MSKRVVAVVAAALALALAAWYVLRPDRGVPDDAPTENEMATAVGSQVMQHLYLGHVPGRSGEVLMVPKPHHFLISNWDMTALDGPTPPLGSTHPNPWSYLTRVPIIASGAGIPHGVTVEAPVDIAAIAPTYARILGMSDFEAKTEADPLMEIAGNVGKQPKLIFTIVIDGGGWNTLQEHPDSWPTIRGLSEEGVTYVNATIGSAPSITGALHATFGTGVYPRTHRLPGHVMRDEEGKLVDVYLDEADPQFLDAPTVSEIWDVSNANRPIVGTVAFEGWHLGMIGHGAQRQGGDKDIAVLWERDEEEWWTNEDYYSLPPGIENVDVARLEQYEEELDPRDGLTDGTWFGHTLEQLRDKAIRPGTPAFVRLTGDVIVDFILGSALGRDEVTDMFWVEMKMPDHAGHSWNMVRPEQADVLRETDAQIARMKSALDEVVGPENYVLLISADHGQQPLPDLHGGWRINTGEVAADIEERFGTVVEKVTPADIFLDMDAMAREGWEPVDVARYLGAYTVGDSIPEGQPGADLVPEGRLDDRVFAGAFSTSFLDSLDPVADPNRIGSFGEGDYPESSFVLPGTAGQ
ncbi:MAG TPA: alkaline phosphatase family protein [Actinomycetota bacterium]|nr:alkaline phosphatase family protein [Actinomycetota bacterium]